MFRCKFERSALFLCFFEASFMIIDHNPQYPHISSVIGGVVRSSQDLPLWGGNYQELCFALRCKPPVIEKDCDSAEVERKNRRAGLFK